MTFIIKCLSYEFWRIRTYIKTVKTKIYYITIVLISVIFICLYIEALFPNSASESKERPLTNLDSLRFFIQGLRQALDFGMRGIG